MSDLAERCKWDVGDVVALGKKPQRALTAAGSVQPDLLELVDDPTMVEATGRLQAMYAAARKIVAARLEGRVAAAGDGTDEITPEEWDLIVAEHAGDVFGDAALDGVVAAGIITRALVSDRDLAELTARHQRSLSSYGPWVSQKVSTWVDEQVASGASTAEIVRRLGEDSPLSPDKAAFVAQTELTAGVNGGLVAGMKEAGVAAKRWVSRRDNRVRPDHIAADGQTVPLDQDFNVGGWPASAPGDPRLPIGERANCRCSVVDVDGMFVRRAVAATKADLYSTASGFGIVGRSTMNKGALQAAVLSHLCMQGLAGGADCPQTLHRMNRVALLAHARAAGIQGRHAMSREDLVTALNDALRGTDQFRATHGYAPAAEMVRFRKEVATARRLAPRTDELATAGQLPPVAVRREARQAVFERHGGPERGYVPCAWCGLKVHPDPRNPGGFDALIPDPINAGAGFGVSNVLPACPGCFRARGEGGLRRAVFRLESAVEAFINKNHDPRTGRFAPNPGGAGAGGVAASPVQSIDDAQMNAHLDGLVAKGVLTADQAAAVRAGMTGPAPEPAPPKPAPRQRKPKPAPMEEPTGPKPGAGTPEAALADAKLAAADASLALDNNRIAIRDKKPVDETVELNAKVMKAGEAVDAAAMARLSPAERQVLDRGELDRLQAANAAAYKAKFKVEDQILAENPKVVGSDNMKRLVRGDPRWQKADAAHRDVNDALLKHSERVKLAKQAHARAVDDVLREVRPGFGTGEIKLSPRSHATRGAQVQEAGRMVPKEWANGTPRTLAVLEKSAPGEGGSYRGRGLKASEAEIWINPAAPRNTAHHEAFHAMESGNPRLHKSQAAYIAVNGGGGPRKSVKANKDLTYATVAQQGAYRKDYSGRVYGDGRLSTWQHFELGSTAIETGHGGDFRNAESHRIWWLGTLASA